MKFLEKTFNTFLEVNWANIEWSNYVIAFATLVLAFLTLLLWRETKKAREHSQASEIMVSVEKHPRYVSAYNLVIENIGQGPAKQIKLSLEEEVEFIFKGSKENIKLNDHSIFKNALPLLKSKQSISHFLFMAHSLENKDINFQVKATWIGYNNERKSGESYIDLRPYREVRTLGHDALHEIAESHKKLSNNFEQVLNSKRLRIETITHEELKKQKEQETKELLEFMKEKAEAKS